jgi:hypothetical protein
MNNNDNRIVAALESKVDMLETELAYLDQILIQCGFAEGIKTLKMAVEEILVEDAVEAKTTNRSES